MKLHELKLSNKYFNDVLLCKKTFEIRKNDRDYQVGDLIHFISVNDNDIHKLDLIRIMNNDNVYRITYVLKDVEEYGLDNDYCILGIKKLYESK